MPFGFIEDDSRCKTLKKRLKKEIRLTIARGCLSFLSGMAMGPDIWCAEMVLEYKKEYPQADVRLTAVIPYRNQPNAYPADYMKRYAKILALADEVFCLEERYAPGCMRKRNRYMVDRADCVIAVFGGIAGGTRDTLRYAQKKGRRIVLFKPDTAARRLLGAQLHF